MGARLQQLRQARGLTQQQLANDAGVSLSTVSKLEEGSVTRPSATTLLKLVGVLNFDLDRLLGTHDLPRARPKSHKPKAADIKFVYFDIGGVLAHSESLLLQRLAAGLNRSLDNVKSLYHTYAPLAFRGQLSLPDIQLLFLLKLNIPFKGAPKRNLFRDWAEYMKPNLAVHQFAAEVAKDYPIGLLTNIFGGGFLRRMQERGLVPELPYRAVIESYEVGHIKPEAAIYNLAAKRAKVAPQQILFIDDRKDNVKGAQAAGWQAEWFNEFKTTASIERIRRKYF